MIKHRILNILQGIFDKHTASSQTFVAVARHCAASCAAVALRSRSQRRIANLGQVLGSRFHASHHEHAPPPCSRSRSDGEAGFNAPPRCSTGAPKKARRAASRLGVASHAAAAWVALPSAAEPK